MEGPTYPNRCDVRCLAFGLIAVVAGGCSSGSGSRPTPGDVAPDAATATMPAGGRRSPVQPDVVQLYRRMGLLAEAGETPFVGSLSFLAGRTPDSTLVVVTVSLANRALAFTREGDRYRAGYNVALDVKRGTNMVRQVQSKEGVRVLTFRETTRTDESVLFREILTLAPGTYDVRLSVRDDAAARGSAIEATVGVPRLADGTVSSPIAFYEATPRIALDSIPKFIATPRATVVFGRDSVLPVYVEGYGPEGSSFPLRVAVRPEGGTTTLWTDSVSLPRRAGLFSGIVNVPISRLSVGVMTIGVSRSGSSDTVRSPVFIGFGEDLPIASFTEMVDYLRYFTSSSRLATLKEAPPDQRAGAWATFLRETDPIPTTTVHEGLRDYFARIAQANSRFREEGAAGWLSDRGRVFVALGSPDQVYEPNTNDLNQRGRSQIWDYRQHRLQVVFIDQTGFGRWRMTITTESEFEAVVRRVLAG